MKSHRPKPAKRKARSRPKKKPESQGESMGSKVRAARTAANMTQLALAHLIGYQGDDAGAYISRVEADHQAPRIDTLQRIADALAVPVCSLLAGK